MGSSCYYVWGKLLKIKYDVRSFKFIIFYLIFCFLILLNYHFSGSYYKVIIAICLFITYLRIFFTKDLKQSIVVAVVLEVIFFIAELLFSIIMLIILNNNIESAINIYFGSFLTNLIICILGVSLCNLPIFTKLYNKLLKITNNIKLSNVLFILAILLISFNIFLMLPYYRIDTIEIVIINSIMMVVYSFIVYKFIEQKNRYIDVSEKYSLTESSLKELQNNVNRLMTANHENKNQLLAIRTMVSNNDKNLLENIDALVDRKIRDDKELKIQTSVLSNTMLGALIYSKLLTIKENNIKNNLHIDRDVSKSIFINLGNEINVDICTIIGVYLDNAIEATGNSLDLEKEINIDLYVENSYLIICIANTFTGNVDVNLVDDYGYTTKSNGHGYGLSLVKEIIKENELLNSETEINDNIFIQKLKIKM